jgi:hypothetical protein
VPGPVVPSVDALRLAARAYLARFKGPSREHTEVHDHGLFVPHVGLAIALKKALARA